MTSPRRRSTSRTIAPIVGGLAAVVLVLSACSDDEPAEPATTSTVTTTTTSPPTSAPDAASGDPLPIAWVRQFGGAGEDSLAAVTGRQDSVVGVGTTTGLTGPPPAGSATVAVADVVAAQDGSPRATTQATQAHASRGLAVTAADEADVALACGTTAGSPTDGAGGPAKGARGTDVWCTPIAADGSLGAITPTGSDADDTVAGVATNPDGTRIFATGGAVGYFPDARDPTGGFLGAGDALVTRLDATGAPRWIRQFGTTEPDAAAGVTTSDDGDGIVVGRTAGRTDGDVEGVTGGGDAWIARMDPDGNQRWLTQFGTSGSDAATAVSTGGDPRRGSETFVAVGATEGAVEGATNQGGEDATASAFDASGRLLWSVQIGSAGLDRATGVTVDGTTVYVAGTAAADIVGAQRIALTPTALPGGEDSSAPSTTAPPATEPPPGGGQDGFLAAVDLETGQVRWVAQFGSAGDDVVAAMTGTESGLIVVAGSTTGQLGSTPAGGGTDGFMVAFVPPAGGGGAARIV